MSSMAQETPNAPWSRFCLCTLRVLRLGNHIIGVGSGDTGPPRRARDRNRSEIQPQVTRGVRA